MAIQGHVDEIDRCKARMDEIANTRPGNLELVSEYESLHERVKELELELAAFENKARAYRVAAIDVRWDLRTQHIQILMDAVYHRTVTVVFLHAAKIEEDLTRISTFSFSRAEGLRTGPVSRIKGIEYLLDIVGLDRLGFYEIADSSWKASLSANVVSGTRHLCLVFADVIIEVLACDFSASSIPGRLEDFNRLRQGRKIT
jgi:hypothetical protein